MRQTVIFAELVLLYLANMENREQQTFISISHNQNISHYYYIYIYTANIKSSCI